MRRLTPELYAISAFTGVAVASTSETRELDFNLARSSGIVINQVVSTLAFLQDVTSGLDDISALVQELDLDPDNVDVLGGPNPEAYDDVVYDSSRVFRHYWGQSLDTAAGTVSGQHAHEERDWTNLPMEQRPISITNMRHTLREDSIIDRNYHAELYIYYFIVELSFEELGILNASRR